MNSVVPLGNGTVRKHTLNDYILKLSQGMTLLWLTAVIPKLKPPSCAESSGTCESATPAQLFVLLFSFGLISIGAGCIRPCSMAFGADQLGSKDKPINERTLQGFFHWYYVSASFSTVLALTAIVYIQDHLGWKVGFGVPAILMLFSALMFLLGSSLYVKVKAETSVFSAFILVFVAAFRKRNLPLSATNLEYHHGKDSSFTAPTDNLRYHIQYCLHCFVPEHLPRHGESDL
jgi:peptide/histidine transporter 3/4